jgi:pSer/pThr/pTyr-binding forkhead associated (FHA) protein
MVDRGKKKGTVIPIRTSPFAMGRNEDCQLRAANQYVSHRHCELRTEGDRILIHDCHSTNGTFINSQKIEDDVELQEGDRLTIGSLTFLICQENQINPSPAPLRDESNSGPISSNRKVDEDAIGDMLLDLDEEESGPPPGAWRNSNSTDTGPERGIDSEKTPMPKKAAKAKNYSAGDVASKMLKGTDTAWIKPK